MVSLYGDQKAEGIQKRAPFHSGVKMLGKMVKKTKHEKT